MPERTVLVVLAATLLAGAPTSRILHFLGLRDGRYHTIRRSNLQTNVHMVFRPLSLGTGGLHFPDLDWILDHKKKTIVFTRSIHLVCRVWAYLWTCTKGTLKEKRVRIRMYTSLENDKYCKESRQLMHNDLCAQVLVATDCLMVGVDFCLVFYCVILSEEGRSSNNIFPMCGRIGCDARTIPEGIAILYHTKEAVKTASGIVEEGTRQRPRM
jgi:hypothetical protein